MSTITKEQFITYIENLTLLEAADLVKELEAKFGVSASAPVMMAAAGPAAAAAEEKTEFDDNIEQLQRLASNPLLNSDVKISLNFIHNTLI